MIDIVFLLIVFFMTLPQLTQVVYHPLELPRVAKAPTDEQPTELVVNIDADGSLVVDGQPLTLQELENDFLNPDRSDKLLHVLIRCDGQCPTRCINQLTSLLNEQGIEQVRLSVVD